MPVISIGVKRLNELLGREFEQDTLVKSLEQLGCDVEDTVELDLYRCPACHTPNDKLKKEDPPRRCEFCGHESEQSFIRVGTDRAIRLDLLADRPDLFDSGGLSRALKGYLGLAEGLSGFSVKKSGISITVDPALKVRESYRPHFVGAVVRMPPLDNLSLREIMKLQENLHWGIGRDRKLASIGIYDLACLTPPFRYTVVEPGGRSFTPLGMAEREMTPREILEHHPKGKLYSFLLENHTRYPLLIDSRDQVLSMPPIINSDQTRCRIGSADLFVDVTGIFLEPAVNCLTTLCSALIEMGGTIESVTVKSGNRSLVTPDLTPRSIEVSYREAVNWLGLQIKPERFRKLLRKMRLEVIPRGGDRHEIRYPAFRTDIRHPVDVYEDLAIGYGYHNIRPRLIPSFTVPRPRREEVISGLAREVMVGMGFYEIMSLQLQSIQRHFKNFLIPPGKDHVVVKNPKTVDQKILRTHLKTGIMETFQKNRRMAVPQKIFEIGNVSILDSRAPTGVAEFRHLAFGMIGPKTGYAQVRAVLDALLRELEMQGEYREAEDPTFITGRTARLEGENGVMARLGEIHPRVLNFFSLAYPVGYCELLLTRVI